jgi:hypothetical protein
MRTTLLLLAALTACGIETAEPTTSSIAAAVWTPHPINPNRCTNPQEPVSRPPDHGVCHVELRLDSMTFATGQGISEGRAELSAIVTATANDTGQTGTAVVDTQKLSVGETAGLSNDLGTFTDLGTYDVPAGKVRDITVCAEIAEDDSGLNGQDDFAHICTVVRLSCDPVTGQASESVPLGPSALCEADGSCNGSAGMHVQVEPADADMDTIPNDQDFTPEPCDEALKGTGGTALLLFFNYDDNFLTSLAQSLWTTLSSIYSSYDYVVLVADSTASNPGGTSNPAFVQADRVYPPTHQGLIDAMRDITSKHYRFDAFVHAHGYKFGPTDSAFESLDPCIPNSTTGECDPWLISGRDLENMTDPNLIGTARGGIPIISYWSTTCISGRQIDSWATIGAKTTSGAVDVQFFPNTWANFAASWVAGTPYKRAVDTSLTTTVKLNSSALIDLQGNLWGCGGSDSVLFKTACAYDFFNDTDSDTDGTGPDTDTDDAKYNISAVYNINKSGLDNMLIASTRLFLGDPTIKFGGAGLTWP